MQAQKKNPKKFKGQLKDCDRCGFTYHKNELTKQHGLWLCKQHCIDNENPQDSISNRKV